MHDSKGYPLEKGVSRGIATGRENVTVFHAEESFNKVKRLAESIANFSVLCLIFIFKIVRENSRI